MAVKPQESNPGRDFNNLLKFVLRCWTTVRFLLAPVIMIVSTISYIIFKCQIAVKVARLEAVTKEINEAYRNATSWGPPVEYLCKSEFVEKSSLESVIRNLNTIADSVLYVAVLTPIAIWLIYSLASWLLDLLDGLFSLGSHSRKEKEQA